MFLKKIHIITAIILASSGDIKSQNYTVGVQVKKHLCSYIIKGKKSCYPKPSQCIIFPSSLITGVTNVIIFDYVSSDSVFINSKQRIKTGDTLYITPTVNKFTFYFPINGEVKCKFYSIGVPIKEGERYNCGELSYIDNDINCLGTIEYFFKNKNCIGIVEKAK